MNQVPDDFPDMAVVSSPPSPPAQPQAGGYQLTAEQQQAIHIALAGHDMKVIAFAGAGKTSTLVAMANALMQARPYGLRILYIAFNKAITEEAKSKFPSFVECRTFDSVVYQWLYRHKRSYLEKTDPSNKMSLEAIKSYGYEDFLKIGGLSYQKKRTDGGDEDSPVQDIFVSLGERDYGRLFYDVLNEFYKSNNNNIEPFHVRRYFVNRFNIDLSLTNNLEKYVTTLLPHLNKFWQDFLDMDNSSVFIGQNFIACRKKIFCLNSPSLHNYDCIMFDEAQDANESMLQTVLNQSCQKIWVGDPNQQIYEWNGAKNALAQIPAVVVNITQSFRFGKEVASVANAVLGFLGVKHPLIGFEKLEGMVKIYEVVDKTNIVSLVKTHGIHAILGRSNKELITVALMLLPLAKAGVQFHMMVDARTIKDMLNSIMLLCDGTGEYHQAWHKEHENFGCGTQERTIILGKLKESLDVVKEVGNTIRKTLPQGEKWLSYINKSLSSIKLELSEEGVNEFIMDGLSYTMTDLDKAEFSTLKNFITHKSRLQTILNNTPVSPKIVTKNNTFINNSVFDALDFDIYRLRNPACSDITAFYDLIEEFGYEEIMELLHEACNHTKGICISTSHKSKGREWGRVLLLDDMLNDILLCKKGYTQEGKTCQYALLKSQSMEEYRLLYVAMTRAKQQLFMSQKFRIALEMMTKTTFQENARFHHYFLERFAELDFVGETKQMEVVEATT